MNFDFPIDFRSKECFRSRKKFFQLIEIQKQKPIEVLEIFTLDQYSDRVVGIGPAKPIVVPVLIKPKTQMRIHQNMIGSQIIAL